MKITLPIHPLYGQEFDIVRVCRIAAFPDDPDLIIDAPSFRGAINSSWTDYHQNNNPDGSVRAENTNLLDLQGLRSIANLITQWGLKED